MLLLAPYGRSAAIRPTVPLARIHRKWNFPKTEFHKVSYFENAFFLFIGRKTVGKQNFLKRGRRGNHVISLETCQRRGERRVSLIILLHEKFLQFDWLRVVVFLLNLKYLHVKITNLVWVVV